MKKQNVRTLSLIICTFTYLLVGAAVFDAMESEFEKQNKERLLVMENHYKSLYKINDTDFEILRHNIIHMVPYKAGTQWKFAGAFYFALTVITTIGYGHSTPQTIAGKIFCMFYAISGIPLNIVMFQSVGERLNAFVTFVVKQLKKLLRMKSTDVSQSNLILIALNLSTIVLITGAAAFAYFEGWEYLDSFYYCFITLTTIGFGDFVALQKHDMLTERVEYVAFSIIFILFGLAVLSAAMNLLILRFLTMNTADERREELEAAAAARSVVRLDGDVITGQTNGNVVFGANETQPDRNDSLSVCSCSCYSLRGGNLGCVRENDKVYGGGGFLSTSSSSSAVWKRKRKKLRYTVTRKPGRITHLLPLMTTVVGASVTSSSVLDDASDPASRAPKQTDKISGKGSNSVLSAWDTISHIKRASI